AVEQLPELGPLGSVELAGRCDVAVGEDHEVPARVRIEIELHVAMLAAVHDQRVLVALLGLGAEDTGAVVFLRRLEVGQAPWRPQSLHGRRLHAAPTATGPAAWPAPWGWGCATDGRGS